MSSKPIIQLKDLGKCYHVYRNPRDRLLQMLGRGRRQYSNEFWALRDISLEVDQGDCLGIVGRNGAGKSTLLQLVCGTLAPTTGTLSIHGRVAALLELGAGFNPEFTGQENVYLNATVLGLSQSEIDSRYEEIVEFSGIGDAIHNQVKTYSSGMFLRLAFSVATSVNPDILIIDEALSVGDGAFSRKSFDRIMDLKNKGTTVLFCSHSLYQVEAICDRVVWLDQGCLKMAGSPGDVTSAYATELGVDDTPRTAEELPDNPIQIEGGRILSVHTSIDDMQDAELIARSMESTLSVRVDYYCNPQLPPPSVLIGISSSTGVGVTSAGTCLDGMVLSRDNEGQGCVELSFPSIPLLKGEYLVNVYLACEQGIHCYDSALSVATVRIVQDRLDQGLVMLPHQWRELPLQ